MGGVLLSPGLAAGRCVWPHAKGCTAVFIPPDPQLPKMAPSKTAVDELRNAIR
jgi:hypothetical protein